MSATVRAAWIAGFFLLVVAIVGILGTRWLEHQRESADVVIIDLASLQAEGNVGIDVVLWNKSVLPQAVTSFTVTWSQGEPPRPPFPFAFTILPNRVYVLQPRIEVSMKSSTIRGTTIPPHEQAKTAGIKYLLDGSVGIYPNRAWYMSFWFPIREQLIAGENISISVLIPESVPVVGVGVNAKQEFPKFDRFTSGDRSKNFHLLAFLKDVHVADLTFQATYGENRKTTMKKRLTF